MGTLIQDTSAISKMGGNKCIGVMIKKNTDGTFGAHTGSDVFGAAAGTYHQFGSMEQSQLVRASPGVHTLTLTTVEMSLLFKNLQIVAAPYSATTSSKKDALDLEDGTILESSDASGENLNYPYFAFIYRGDPIGGKEQAFYFVGQVQAESSITASSNKYSKPTIKLVSVNADGYTHTNPTSGEVWLTDVTEPVLSGNKAMGVWAEGA